MDADAAGCGDGTGLLYGRQARAVLGSLYHGIGFRESTCDARRRAPEADGALQIGYATILLIMLHLGSAWLARTGKSQEYLDSWVIMLWGIVNTFTEHHDAWNKNWSHKDMQHTMMGVLWWAGGALGIFLSRGGKRSFVPAVM